MLYHKDIGIPVKFTKMFFHNALLYTFHAKERALEKNIINLPKRITDDAMLIEVEVNNGVCVKQVWRVKYDSKFDLCIVVTDTLRVKTVWLNSKTDSHKTLDTRKYSTL